MNLIRYYNQNRKKIWGIIIITIFAFVFLYLLNDVYNRGKENRQPKVEKSESDISTNTTKLTTDQSVITGEDISNKKLETATTVIDQFVSYCNNKELEKAYNMLSEDCKNEMYESQEQFEEVYYNNVFEGKSKTCTIENWHQNTYQVKILDDLLATGKSKGNKKQDYITIVEEDKETKLNINRYIGKKTVDKTTEKDNIKMEVVYKNTYMEYEEYTINVTNNTDSIMVLDGGVEADSLYLEDKNEVIYSSYSHELTEPMLTVDSGQTKEVTIKFYSSYIATKKIENIVFSDLTLYKGQLSETKQFKTEV